MNREEKIKWYEEILKIDPSSKFYFQLAILYVEENLIEQAITTLQSGLEKHPEDLEARLLLTELLIKSNRLEEAKKEIAALEDVLKKYPLFWEFWSKHLQEKGQIDAGIAVSFLANFFKGEDITWQKILISGLKKDVKEEVKDIDFDVSLKEEELSEEAVKDEVVFETKTMAELLESQGEYEKALSIYKKLLEDPKIKDKDAVLDKIKNLEEKIINKEEHKPGEKIINFLESLVERIQRRISVEYG